MNVENMALHAFRQYGDQVLRLACCYTADMREAEEITASVFQMLMEQNPTEIQGFLLQNTAAQGRGLHQHGVLAMMPEDCAAVLYLHDYEGMEPERIGSLLGERTQYIIQLLEQGRELLGKEGSV